MQFIKYYKISFSLLLFFYGMNNACCQDAFFSQINNEDIYFSPSLSYNALLSDTKAKIDLQFRDQWNPVSKGDSYTTIKFQSEYNIYKSNIDSWNAGILLFSDKSNTGFLTQTAVRLCGAYTRKISEGSSRFQTGQFLTFGASFGFAQTSLDSGNLWFGRQYDTSLLFINPTLPTDETLNFDDASYTDLNLGLKWEYILDAQTFYLLALGIDHINRPALSSTTIKNTLAPRLSFMAQVQSQIAESLSQQGSLAVLIQNPYYQIIPSYKLLFGLETDENDINISFGLSARVVQNIDGILLDAVIFHLGLIDDKWHVEFSFDMNTSDLGQYINNNGAIELSFGYNIITD